MAHKPDIIPTLMPKKKEASAKLLRMRQRLADLEGCEDTVQG